GERRRRADVVHREAGESAKALPLARRGVERPGEARERPAGRCAGDLLLGGESAHIPPERAGGERGAPLGRRPPPQGATPPGALARRVEEIAVAGDRAGPFEPGLRSAPEVVVEKRRRPVAPRKAALFEPEKEDGVEGARARSLVVDDCHAPFLPCAARADGRG